MSDLKTIRQQCKDFAKLHLKECCAEILEWQDTAVLRDGKVRELAAMVGGFISNHDTLRVAESFISRAAIEAATAAPTDAKTLRDAVLEEAAEACDNLHHPWKWDDEPDSDSGPRSCARAIRAMKSSPQAPKQEGSGNA